MALILAIDTAHEVGYMALGDELFLMEGNRHSDAAAVLLEKLWREDIEAIGVGIGPGSYTGLRVGIALAQGLHLATGIPLLEFCSLEPYWEPGTVSLFDARAGGVYCWDGERAWRASIEELGAVGVPLASPDAEKIERRLSEAGFQREVRQANLALERLTNTLTGRLRGGGGRDSPVPLYLKNLGYINPS